MYIIALIYLHINNKPLKVPTCAVAYLCINQFFIPRTSTSAYVVYKRFKIAKIILFSFQLLCYNGH